ncbi:MAG: NUDIX hydrolase [Chloroflexi bacterium]|nr:NUDIX hydrolase [Chloroflexota bacterium]
MKASTYKAKDNEANFGEPIEDQIKGGTHITLELVTKKGDRFCMTKWPQGLPRHEDPPNALRFPHGLMIFGETPEESAARLVKDQLGMAVDNCKIAYMESYLDDMKHWHIELGFIVDVSGNPKIPRDAEEIVEFTAEKIPKMTFWSRADFLEFLDEHLPELIAS